MLPALLPGTEPRINLLSFPGRRNISVQTQIIEVQSVIEPIKRYCNLSFHIAQLYQKSTQKATFSTNIQ